MASIQVDKGEEYQFWFDNTSSLFAGKAVSFRHSWSSEPIYPVMPYFGEHEDTETCAQLKSQYVDEGFPVGALINLAFAVGSGNWLGAILPALELYISATQTEPLSGTILDKASRTALWWACGVVP